MTKSTVMFHFVNVTSFEDLKAQYRALALANHPDRGGDPNVMKSINNEYDQLFPVWKHHGKVSGNETAAGTRFEFYTENGWKGENYNSQIRLKEIANIIREYVKDIHNDYRFSITTEHGSMTQTLNIAVMEAPADVFAAGSEKAGHIQSINFYTSGPHTRNRHTLTPEFAAVLLDVQKLVSSYNRDDSDSMTDYFDRYFYERFDLGKWDKPYKIVPRVRRAPSCTEYETVEVVKTRTYKVLKPRDVERPPSKFAPGQLFQLKAGFNYGCRRGDIYQIDQVYGGIHIQAYKLGKGYKNMCKGNVCGNSFSASDAKMKKWLSQGAIRFVELVEVIKTDEYMSSVRRPKKRDMLADANEQPMSVTPAESIGYTITPDTDTRDGSPLWVLRITQKLDREAYKDVADVLKRMGGYYSKFKHGFIFRDDPSGIALENTLKEMIEVAR